MSEVKKTEKKPNFFVRVAAKTLKYFRELRAELRKVVWPSFNSVVKNTGVVIVTVLMVSVLISLFGIAATQGVSLLINLGK